MTCIVGWVENGKVCMGADSAGISGWQKTLRKDPKVFRNGEFLIGFTSSFRMGQLIRYSFTPPVQDGEDSFEYLATKWVNALRECLKQGGFATLKDSVETGGTLLVGYRGRLFRVDDDYQVGESQYPFDAVGSGAQVALGACYALFMAGMVPTPPLPLQARVLKALQAASCFNIGVSDPFNVETL